MNKDFLESCKILKKHFNKITTDGHNNIFEYVSRKDEIISKAKLIISEEESDVFIDKHIKNIKENTVAKYTKELEDFLNPSKHRKDACQIKNIRWDDNIWDAPVPKKKTIWTSESKNDMKNHDAASLTTIGLVSGFSQVSTHADQDSEIETMVEEIEKEDEIILEKEKEKIEPLQIMPLENNYKICLTVKKLDLEDLENLELDNALQENYEIQTNKENNKPKIEEKHRKNPELGLKIQKFLQTIEHSQMQTATSSMANLTDIQKKCIKKSQSSINLSAKVSSKFFVNRFKAQKDIIEHQKKKLKEQEQLIQDLKLKKIQTEAKKALATNSEIYHDTIIKSERLKWKAKLCHEHNQVKKENEELKFSIKFVQAPKIVQVMEERQKEREERRLMIKERKRLLDEEKQRQAEEIVKRKEQEEFLEKQKRLEVLKAERERQRQLQIQRSQEKIKFLELNKNAFLHYKTKLLYKGLATLKQAIEDRKIKEEIAVKLYEFNTALNFFRSWKSMSNMMINEKNQKANDLYATNLYRKALGKWKKLHQDSIKKMQVAQDFYELKLMHKVFASFHHLICVWHIQFLRNSLKADEHYYRTLLFQTFDTWQTFPTIMKIERKKNERKKKWRQKVAEILPDYHPIFDD